MSEEHRHLRLSWSALLRHEECHFKEMSYRDGQKRAGTIDGRPFIGGSIADKAMREWLEQDNPVPGTLVEFAQPVFQRLAIDEPERPIRWKGVKAEDQAKVLADVTEALEKLDPWLSEHVLPYDYHPEARGTGAIGVPDIDGTIRGVELFFAVDIATRPGKYRLYDLKVTRNESYISGKTLMQLAFYSLGWAANVKVPVTEIEHLAFITPLTKVFETPVRPDVADYRYLMTRITQYAQGVWSNERSTKREKDSDCTYKCDVRHDCPLFAVTKQPNGRVSLLKTAQVRREGIKGAVDSGVAEEVDLAAGEGG